VLGTVSVALGLPAENPWGRFTEPAPGAARAIGEYSAGCLQGAVALPLDGPGYQVMHPSRLRYFGHPDLIGFVRQMGKQALAKKLGVVLVGDLSQPRGGRASHGHSSHQSGLDVDVWYWHPKAARKAPLSAAERESLSARTILAKGAVQPAWKQHVTELLKLVVADERVERVFVNPIIKRELCTSAGANAAERGWLRKIRPWYGHDDHFHARLRCPADSHDCTPQAALSEGDGCDQLDFWFDEKAQAERKKAQTAYQQNVIQGRGWPAQCEAMLRDLPAETLGANEAPP
jgi:penicillin-insensitive murein endopeptidase